jgi:bis(5'-nucleosyl)-tetraphosphatase (symmetrical)
MAIYVMGDIQGCFAALEKLLAHIHFDRTNDELWVTGDLVNRGPQSLEVLRFMQSLGESQITVLGNHDLHLLSVAYGVATPSAGDTLEAILQAPDKINLIEWLRHRPLLYYDEVTQYILVHAGLAPCWSLTQAIQLAHEVEEALQGDHPALFLEKLYGNQPDQWEDGLQGTDRLRCIVNYLTRMRLCHADGRLELSYKGAIANKPGDLIPWFNVSNRVSANEKIIFGHWAALNGETGLPDVYAMDTGCVWGNCLTAMRLNDKKRFSVHC